MECAAEAGLDFQKRPKELFEGKEMGEDALLLFLKYQFLLQEVIGNVGRENKLLKESLKWSKTIGIPPRHL